MPDPWRAALALVALCVLVSLPRARGPLPPCEHPGQRDARPRPIAVCDDPAAPALTGPARRLFGLPIDLNRADAETLASLPGIGPSRARAIVEARPFASVGELRRVRGIGPTLLARLRPLVEAGPGRAAPKAGTAENR